MTLVATVSAVLVAASLVERCRATVERSVAIPSAEGTFALAAADLPSGETPAASLSRDSVAPGFTFRTVPGMAVTCATPSADAPEALHTPPLVSAVGFAPVVLQPAQVEDIVPSDVRPSPSEAPTAKGPSPFACVVPQVPCAVRRLPTVVVPEPRGLTEKALAVQTDRMVYAALADGTANPRAREWRLSLVRMLVDGTPGTDFDRVYGFLLRGFGGNDERAKIRALAKWAEESLSPREAADVFRAETRHWLNLGEAAMTADAARRMELARPDYAVRARRLSALAYAMSGELEKAKAEMSRSRAECELSSDERQELAYLEAWVALQDGDVELARRNLTAIVAESPDGATARKARRILESISEEARE